jgi:UDP-N-acetylmuramoyl-tripeptide--D-alanyl-D-alanine ligase
MRFDEHFLHGALADAVLIDNHFPQDAQFAVDTRNLQEGDIFVALSGLTTDGHCFLEDALKKGAAGIMLAVDRQTLLKSIDASLLKKKLIIAVPDTLQALIRLAMAWRDQYTYPVIGITGSVGKTSTKETLANICKASGMEYLVSRGNENTKIGISLNMLRMRKKHQVAIFEVGINKRGEMAELARILRPTSAVITSIGHSHMEGLGSLGDIVVEKRTIFKYFNEESIGIINGDIAMLADVGYAHPVIKFGLKTTNQIQARKIVVRDGKVSCVFRLYKERYPVTLPYTHEGLISNALAACAVAHLLGIPTASIIKGVQEPLYIPGRFEQRQLFNKKGIIIHDAYNANPESMKASLLAFEAIKSKSRKVAVLGDMLELGTNSPFWHRQLGRFLRKVPSLNHIILVGSLVQWTHKTLPVGVTAEIVPDWQTALDSLKKQLDQDLLVLVKGSRGMKLNNLVDAVTKQAS